MPNKARIHRLARSALALTVTLREVKPPVWRLLRVAARLPDNLTDPGPVKAILDHLGLPSTGPPLVPARFTTGPGETAWQNDVPELQQSLR